MTKQFFPNSDDMMAIIMGEIPPGVYADDLADDPDEDKRSYSSSELRAHAILFSNAYDSLFSINQDKHVSTATQDGLTKWEKDLFSTAQDSNLPLETRRQNALAKLRTIGGINDPTMRRIVAAILGPGIDFDILPYSGSHEGAWILDESSLGLNTWLSKIDPLYGYLLDNDLDYAAAGITLQDLLDIQEVAYTFEVRIYANVDADTLARLDRQLTQYEPARSTHVIRNNYTRPVI